MPTRTAEPAKTAAPPPSRTARDGLTIRRRRCGTGFSYYGKDGRRIVDPGVIRRLARLAVPPAYADVVYAEDESAPLQAMGRDAAGRWQYRYHSDWEKVRERRKTRHLVRLIGALPRIRRHVTSVLSTRQPTREFAMAAVIALIDATGIRAGTSRHARLSGARGAVTLLKSNVQLNGRTVTLAFKAKGGKQVVKEVQEPRLLAGCKVSLKDFRMFRACVNVVETLARTEPGESQARRKRQVKQAIQTAAEDLANTVSICRKSYVHEAVIEAFEQGKLNGKAKTPNGRPAPPQRVLAEVVAAHVPG
jgi:DNA topoisomerase-1